MSRPTGDSPPRMRGANGSTAGARGLVPRPAAADNVKYLKGDGSWSAVTNASAATNAEAAAATSTTTFVTPANAAMAVAAVRNGLAPAQGLAFTGGQDAAVANVPASPDYFSIFMWVKLDETLADSGLWSGTAGFGIVTGSNQLQVNGGSAYYTATNGSALNEWACVGYTKALTVGTFWLNGKSNGVVSDTDAWSGALVTYFNKRTFADGKKTISRPFIYNRALTAAEVLALYQSGAPAAADYDRTSQISTDSWSSGGSWTGFTSTTTTVSGTANNESAAVLYPAASFVRGSWGAGLKWRFSGTADTLAGTMNVYYYTGSTYVAIGTISATGAFNFTFTGPTVTGSGGNIYVQTNAAGAISLSGLTVTRLGLLLAPDSNNAGAGLEWLDVSGNRAHIILPTSGVSWSLPSSQQIVIEASTATNGNQQLGGASLIDANKQWRIQSWTVNCSTGTPTVSLGNVSAGAQYVSGAVMAAGNNDITLLARFPSTANLWASSTTTATLIHRIVLVPAN